MQMSIKLFMSKINEKLNLPLRRTNKNRIIGKICRIIIIK